MAQLVERSAVNRQVLGSIPSGGVFFPICSERSLHTVTQSVFIQSSKLYCSIDLVNSDRHYSLVGRALA